MGQKSLWIFAPRSKTYKRREQKQLLLINDFSQSKSLKRFRQKKPRVLRVEARALAIKTPFDIIDKGYQPLSNR
ncbi:MAG: hypothetical protein E7E11_11260, partial [Enterococcus faecalis]|nr:hypothetical protein [Enterococcus faecalis]